MAGAQSGLKLSFGCLSVESVETGETQRLTESFDLGEWYWSGTCLASSWTQIHWLQPDLVLMCLVSFLESGLESMRPESIAGVLASRGSPAAGTEAGSSADQSSSLSQSIEDISEDLVSPHTHPSGRQTTVSHRSRVIAALLKASCSRTPL